MRPVNTSAISRRSEPSNRKNFLRYSRFLWCVLIVSSLALPVVPAPSLAYASEANAFVKRFELPRDPHPVVDEILSRPEFNEDFSQSALEELRDALIELTRRALRWLSKHFPRMPDVDLDPAPAVRIVETGLIVALLLAAAIVAWFAVKYFLSRKRARPVVPEESLLEAADIMGSEEALAAARAMAAEAKYTEALVYLFRFVLLRLDERGEVTLRPGKTNREILWSVPQDAPIRQPLSQMILLFNRVRYGNEGCGRAAFNRFVSLSRRVTGGA